MNPNDIVRVFYPSGSVSDMPRRRAAIVLIGNPNARIVELVAPVVATVKSNQQRKSR